MTCLPDINVWVSLATEKHTHHELAKNWFQRLQNERLVFCRLTQLGFLRLLTNKHVMQGDVMRPDGAWRAYRELRSDHKIGYFAEPSGLSEMWDQFMPQSLVSSSIWTDAYLCAFVHAARLTLVTFDKKIQTKQGVSCMILDS